MAFWCWRPPAGLSRGKAWFLALPGEDAADRNQIRPDGRATATGRFVAWLSEGCDVADRLERAEGPLDKGALAVTFWRGRRRLASGTAPFRPGGAIRGTRARLRSPRSAIKVPDGSYLQGGPSHEGLWPFLDHFRQMPVPCRAIDTGAACPCTLSAAKAQPLPVAWIVARPDRPCVLHKAKRPATPVPRGGQVPETPSPCPCRARS